jgi:2'-5' RNA ligase
MFFALWPDDEVRERLRAVQRDLASTGGRRVHPEDLHITLVFLGQVRAEQLPCVQGAAGRVDSAPLVLRLDRQGWWRGPRVAWCAPADMPAALPALVDQLWRGLRECGFEREARPYRPHVTLLRKARPLPGGLLAAPIPWQVRDFVLVTSDSQPEGPRYKVLQRWPLTATEQIGLENQ